MTQSRWMPIGILALLLGAVPVNAQNFASQIGSALALGQEQAEKRECPCCLEIECCVNPVNLFQQIVAQWLGVHPAVFKDGDVTQENRGCKRTSGVTGPEPSYPTCPVPTECVECPLSLESVIGTATGEVFRACGVDPVCGSASRCCASTTSSACAADAACCGDNCKCCDNCKCKKATKCQCCKNCDCNTCGTSNVQQCPFLSQIHGIHRHPARVHGLKVIHLGGRHPMFMPPSVVGHLPGVHPLPVFTEVHPPIPLFAGQTVGCPFPAAGGNPVQVWVPQPQPRPMMHGAVANPMMPRPPGQLVVNARRPQPQAQSAVRIQATPNGVLIQGKGLKARCDRIAYHGHKDVVELEGNVRIEYRQKNRSAEIVAERVVVHLREGSFEIEPARATGNVTPTSYYNTVDTPETLPRPVRYPTPRDSQREYVWPQSLYR